MNNKTLDIRDWIKRKAGELGIVDVNTNLTFRHNSTINVKDYVIYCKLLLSTTFLNTYANNSVITTK
jgi:hypothetical protein